MQLAYVGLSADKPGRTVIVEVEQGLSRDGSTTPYQPSIAISGRLGESQWVWLTPDEAREIAAALEHAATTAEMAQATDLARPAPDEVAA